METRAKTRGAPLKKPGAYDTSKYYQEKDEGFGDVGVGQEADAGQLDNPEDKDFTVTREDEQAAEAARNEPLAEGGGEAQEARADLEDLRQGTKAGPAEVDARGEPVPITDEGPSLEEQEAPENTPVVGP